MKRTKFNNLFLTSALIIFIAHRSVYTSALLMLASINMLIDVIPKLRKELKK